MSFLRLLVMTAEHGKIKVVDFKNGYDNPTKTNEFKKDPELENKIDTWGLAFMHVLLEEYNEYKVVEISIPRGELATETSNGK